MNTETFAEYLAERVDFFAGVPDSLLKDLVTALKDRVPPGRFRVAADEGAAVALAAGHFLATGRVGAVYLQNSGLGHALNPALSLNDPLVSAIPIVLLVGWRGRPGQKDEPQHIRQGQVSEDLIRAAFIPLGILPAEEKEARVTLDQALEKALERRGPVALLIEKGTFEPYSPKSKDPGPAGPAREAAIEALLEAAGERARLVATTGMISRELYELREKRGQGHERDFLTVGAMGHASQIALGLALARPDEKFICLEGDGALLMHLGGLATIGTSEAENFVHVVLNNQAHDSVGGQPTVAGGCDLPALARACGYSRAESVADLAEIGPLMSEFIKGPGRFFLEIKVARGARPDLGRPGQSPDDNARAFAQALKEARG